MAAATAAAALLLEAPAARAMKLSAPPGSALLFGGAVAADASRIFVGAPDSGTGTVHLFDGADSSVLLSLPPLKAQGTAIAFRGSDIVVGIHGYFVGMAGVMGRVQVRDSGTGALLGECFGSDPVLGQSYGDDVAGFGSNVLVGEPLAAPGYMGPFLGAINICDPSTGDNIGGRISPNPSDYGGFGTSVADFAGDVLVGAPGENTYEGAVYLFDGGDLSLIQTFVAPANAATSLGDSVGAIGSDVLAGSNGAAYRFDVATGAVLQTFEHPVTFSSTFGQTVAALGSNVLVGDVGDDELGTNAGAAYLFDGTTGDLLWTFHSPSPQANGGYGGMVAAFGDYAVVGAAGEDGTVGAVYVVAPFCGNAAMDPGEQCDDGNAADGDCCSATCQFESNTTVCRASVSACDPTEYCTGSSPTCPSDVTADADGDAVCDGVDNCPSDFNADQSDVDSDALGDPCDDDEGPGTLVLSKATLRYDNSAAADKGSCQVRAVLDDSDSVTFVNDLVAGGVLLEVTDAGLFDLSTTITGCIVGSHGKVRCTSTSPNLRLDLKPAGSLAYSLRIKIKDLPDTVTGSVAPTAPAHVALRYGEIDRLDDIGETPGTCHTGTALSCKE